MSIKNLSEPVRLEQLAEEEAELRAVGVTFADDLRRIIHTPEGVQS